MNAIIASGGILFSLLGAMLRAESPLPAELSGGATTVFNGSEESFGLPLANASAQTRRFFIVGNSFFTEPWTVARAAAGTSARDGLGPLFHARACFECHVRDGRGTYPVADEPLESVLIRCSIPGADPHGGPHPHPVYGTQLATQAIPGALPEITAKVEWKYTEGKFPDGEVYQLRAPDLKITQWHDGPPTEPLLMSLRMTPSIVGLGLLEAVPETHIRALADPDDADHDEISGRTNEVWDQERKERRLGRFGWKASVADLRQQTVLAFLHDQGIRSSVLPEGDFTQSQNERLGKYPSGGFPEISEILLQRVVTYVRALGPPARRAVEDPQVIQGEILFRTLGCAKCHQETLTTGVSPELKELDGQTIHPYTDLLLHDLGPGLADGRPDYAAASYEWRTTPLWGMGLNEMVNGHVNFLHDGRARTPIEAILWHEGESAAATAAFRALKKSDRDALLRFLDSL